LRKNALRAEGKKLVQRVQRFVEAESGRIGYAMTAAVLSEANNGATWEPDPSFSVADAILDDPEFVSVLRAKGGIRERTRNRSRAEGEA
jgi:hypothetical protein